MGAEIAGKNRVQNPGFEWSEGGATFPEAWLPLGGDAATQWIWSTENAVEGVRTIKVVNPSFTANVTGAITHPAASFPVALSDLWVLEAFMMTDSPGKELRLILVLLDSAGNPVGERHLKFVSSASMRRYAGIVQVPVAAAAGQVAVGMHDTGTLWADYVSARRVFPNEPELRREIIADEGRMFTANTGLITVPGGSLGVGRLENPLGSGRMIYVERVDFSTTASTVYT